MAIRFTKVAGKHGLPGSLVINFDPQDEPYALWFTTELERFCKAYRRGPGFLRIDEPDITRELHHEMLIVLRRTKRSDVEQAACDDCTESRVCGLHDPRSDQPPGDGAECDIIHGNGDFWRIRHRGHGLELRITGKQAAEAFTPTVRPVPCPNCDERLRGPRQHKQPAE